MIRFLENYPALFIKKEKILAIADLHLGLEHELFKSGIVIPPQAEKFGKTIDELLEKTRAKVLVILGDVKHEVPGISYREEREIPKLFSRLIERVKIVCCKGNHDSFLERILPKGVRIYSSRGFKIGKYGFFHGHAWPSKKLMECDYLLMGHIHPVIEIRDSLGYRAVEQVWVRTRLNKGLIREKYKTKKTGRLELIILPSFNKLVGGIALNKLEESELAGPLISKNFVELDKAKIYLLDGTFLGNLKLIKASS
ncbi:MAG: phosphoesterase [Candidatus Aenigmatarchaeota archaeon]|nr:MAG: phosphoesterase [Candidatus Aenigmarchaeota archaeon]